jgi:hypothetical protein
MCAGLNRVPPFRNDPAIMPHEQSRHQQEDSRNVHGKWHEERDEKEEVEEWTWHSALLCAMTRKANRKPHAVTSAMDVPGIPEISRVCRARHVSTTANYSAATEKSPDRRVLMVCLVGDFGAFASGIRVA